MKLQTITQVAPDAGPIPAEPYKPPAQLWFAVPAVFWAAVLALVGMAGWKKHFQQVEAADLSACQLDITRVNGQRNQLIAKARDLAQREQLAHRISAWTESTPMLQPTLVAILSGIEANDMKVTQIRLMRHSGDSDQYDLHLSLVGDISHGDQTIAMIRERLALIHWDYEEHGTVPNHNTVEYDSLLTPRRVAN
jgi:hypothetical protein